MKNILREEPKDVFVSKVPQGKRQTFFEESNYRAVII